MPLHWLNGKPCTMLNSDHNEYSKAIKTKNVDPGLLRAVLKFFSCPACSQQTTAFTFTMTHSLYSIQFNSQQLPQGSSN